MKGIRYDSRSIYRLTSRNLICYVKSELDVDLGVIYAKMFHHLTYFKTNSDDIRQSGQPRTWRNLITIPVEPAYRGTLHCGNVLLPNVRHNVVRRFKGRRYFILEYTGWLSGRLPFSLAYIFMSFGKEKLYEIHIKLRAFWDLCECISPPLSLHECERERMCERE